MSKQQSYYISLTSDAHAAFNVKVASKTEMEKARPLFSNLVSLCQNSLNNSSTPQEFFKELKGRLEKFSEFTAFFETNAVSMATAITQMRFHSMLVDSWDKQYAKILCTRVGEKNKSYDLPPPSMVVNLESKTRAKLSDKNYIDEYNSVGAVEVSYGFMDEDGAKLDKLSKDVPAEAIQEAIDTMMKDVEKLHRKAIRKVLVDCGLEPKSSELSVNDDFIGAIKRLGTQKGDKYQASNKMHELIDKMNIKASDDFDDILSKLMSNPETRKLILEDFKRWRAEKDGEDDEFAGMMPIPGEFVAEA